MLRVGMLLGVLSALLSGCGSEPRPEPAIEGTFVVRDVRVFDGEQVAESRSVVIQNGVIRQVGGSDLVAPADAQIIDGSGRTLLPGLIDAHVHLGDSNEANLRQALSLGVTTVFDMGSSSTVLDQLEMLRSSDRSDIADVRMAGNLAEAPDGSGEQSPTYIDDATEAAAFVNARIEEGSDYVKIFYDDVSWRGLSRPMLDRETVSALIASAHERGMRAVVHALSEQRAREAVEAEADGLVHSFLGPSVSADFAGLAKSNGTFVIPTLGVLHEMCGLVSGESVVADPLLLPYIRPDLRPSMSINPAPDRVSVSCEGTDAAVRQLAGEGVPILAGTDSPVPSQTYGASLHGELAVLVSAGLTPIQALTAATSAPAQAFGLSDRGRIGPGFRADLVLVDGDPTTDILATRRIDSVWKRGVPVERTRYDE